LLKVFISIIGVSLFFGCNKEPGMLYQPVVSFEFQNSTEHSLKIRVKQISSREEYDIEKFIEILPNSGIGISNNIDIGPSKTLLNIDDDSIQELLDRFLLVDMYTPTIQIDNALYASFSNSGFSLISNYKVGGISDWSKQYLYTFTDADFTDAKSCDE